jgi:formylglycine-generating enzyme required for sulfatase activity
VIARSPFSSAPASLVGALLLGVALPGCGEREAEQLPPFGELVLSIDTDAPVPALVSRLRIDVFSEGGSWLESRDIARNNLDDWPVSFSLYTRDERTPRTVLVRLRGYPEGRLRDYHGERFHERAPYVEPWVASTLRELCANVPELVLGQDLTLRRGNRPLTSYVPRPTGDQCWAQAAGGVVAAQLRVTEAAEYRIETTRVVPTYGTSDPNLFIRSDCRDARSELACVDDISITPLNLLSRIVMRLEPGSYTVMSGALYDAPSDVTLRADLAASWVEPQRDAPPPAPLELPRRIEDGVDVTPLSEPQPLITIDRLALLTLVPGQKKQATVVLRTACSGQMSKLSRAASNADPVPTEAETCIDTEGERAPLHPQEPWSAAPTASLAGTFAFGDRCPSESSPALPVCIPGGTFVLGSPIHRRKPLSTTPERFAVMNRFWLDRTEVTVGRWRSALGKRFVSPSWTPLQNNRPLVGDGFEGRCTFSASANSAGQSREDFPLNCVDWYAARAFCQFQGGDLPSEAQWQYAATKAGRTFEIDNLCDPSPGSAPSPTLCREPPDQQVRSLDDPSLADDVTPLGVRGLVGNVSEWTLDAFQSLDSRCWDAASLIDPLCWEEQAPERTSVGGNGLDPYDLWRTPVPAGGDPKTPPVNAGSYTVGFRCAYEEAPP